MVLKINVNQNQKTLSGQIFLMSVLLLTIVSLAGLIVLTVFNKNLKKSYEIGESIKAIFVSDSCIEWQVYKDINGIIQEPTFSNIEGAVSCSSSNKIIENQYIMYTGTIKNISRILEIKTSY